MIDVFRAPVTAAELKAKALACGADLVGIADGETMNRHPPDPEDPRVPHDLSELDSDRVIVMAKHLAAGTSRIPRWDDRHKFYNDEIALTRLEQASLDLVYWLEDKGYPAVIVPPTHTDPWRYGGAPDQHLETLLSLNHAAVEAGLGTLGLNLQLLTPQFGPRVLLTAVLCSAPVEPDRRMEQALCLGPACGRCLSTCPGNAVKHWDRDWVACDKFRLPYGFHKLAGHLTDIINEDDPEAQARLIASEETFYLWQSILRGAGAMNGCRSCQEVCPVGADYEASLRDVREAIPQDSEEKRAALSAMVQSEDAGRMPPAYDKQRRWVGRLAYRSSEE